MRFRLGLGQIEKPAVLVEGGRSQGPKIPLLPGFTKEEVIKVEEDLLHVPVNGSQAPRFPLDSFTGEEITKSEDLLNGI